MCSLRAVGGEGRPGPAFFLWCHVMFGKKYKVSPQNEKLSVESAGESGHQSSLRKGIVQDFHCLSHIPHAHLSCWSRTQAHKLPLLVSIKDLPVSFIHIMSLTVSNTPPKLFPISFNLMTEWIWQPSSCGAPLLCLLPIWDACLSAVRGLLAAVFIWLWGQYTQGLDAQRERLSAKCFGWRRRARALMRRDSLRGRNAAAWGRTDLVMSKWGRLFRRHECIRVCLSGQHVSQNMCLRVWSIW